MSNPTTSEKTEEGPTRIISLEEYQEAVRSGQSLDLVTLVLLPVIVLQEIEQRLTDTYTSFVHEEELHKHQMLHIEEALVMLRAGASDGSLLIDHSERCELPVYKHLLYFASKEQAESAKQKLLTRKPRVVEYLSIAVTDVSGDSVLELRTKDQLGTRVRSMLKRAVQPAFESFNVVKQFVL